MARVKAVVPDGSEEVFDCQVPGINAFDANGIWAHNCGEQPLPPYGSCLLGSVNLTKFVLEPFSEQSRFDWEEFRKVVKTFTRMLDNVVEINGLPLEGQRKEIFRKRRHGMGFLGLGSTLTMLRMKYGDDTAVDFTESVARELALAGWETALELAREKGPAPIMLEEFRVTREMLRRRPEMVTDGWHVGDMIPGTGSACALQSLHAAGCRSGARAGQGTGADRRTLFAPQFHSRRPGRSPCPWPTMRATVSSRALPITISAM